MQPNLPPPVPPESPNPNSIDYLNSISQPERVNTVSPLLLWGLIGGVILVIGFFFILLASTAGPSQGERFASYIYRLQALRQLSEDSSKTIQSSDLRASNGTAGAILASAEQESTSYLAASGIEKLSKASETGPVATEFAGLATKLDDARLNVTFDSTYAREIGYQLGQLRVEIKILSDGTNSEPFRAYLKKTDTNLAPLIDEFNEFNAGT